MLVARAPLFCIVGLVVPICVAATAPRLLAQPSGPEFRVNTYTTGFQYGPSPALGRSGDFVVVWASNAQDGSAYGLCGQRYASSGMPVGVEFRVNAYSTNAHLDPAVAIGPVGDFVVVWSSYVQDGSLNGVFGQRYASSGAPLGPQFRVSAYTTSSQQAPSLAIGPVGDFVVAWSSLEQDGSLYGVFGQRYGSSGAPLGAEFRVNAYTTDSQKFVSAAIAPTGDFVVVWSSYAQDSSAWGVFGQRYGSSGTPLGPQFRVNTYTTLSQLDPAITIGPGGDFVVVWASYGQDASSHGVFGQRYGSSGTPLGPEFRVNTYTTSFQGVASVAIDPAGDFVVVWSSYAQDSSTWGVFGQRFGGSGTPLGPEFRVNTYTTGEQRRPSVAGGPGGSFAVAWESIGQDGSGAGVFAQRYCPNLAGVTIDVSGATTLCSNSTGGIAAATDVGGGAVKHQWGYRTMSGTGTVYALSGQTAATYPINGASFPPGALSFLVCLSTPACGALTISNEIPIVVSPPPTTATVGGAQTICAASVSAPLGGNAPTSGTGSWSLVGGGTGAFSNAGDPNATFTLTSGSGPFVVRWTISNGPCPDSSADVTLSLETDQPLVTPPSDITVTQSLCE